jgi:hypothetical protein
VGFKMEGTSWSAEIRKLDGHIIKCKLSALLDGILIPSKLLALAVVRPDGLTVVEKANLALAVPDRMVTDYVTSKSMLSEV